MHDDAQLAELAMRSPAHAAFAAFMRAGHAQRQLLLRRLARHDAHPAQMFCIKALSERDGITQRDLAEVLHVTRPTVTVMLQKMEKGGLIERRVDERDQRFTRIYLTDKGWALHEEIHETLDEVITSGISCMSDKDQRELARLLDMLAENMRAALDVASAPEDAPSSDADASVAAASRHDGKARR